MALSRKERNAIRSEIAEALDRLMGDNALPRKERQALRMQIEDLLAKLEEVLDIQKEGEAENQKLKDLIAGKFNKKNHREFLVILDEIVREIGNVEPVKEPIINYIGANQDKLKKAAGAGN